MKIGKMLLYTALGVVAVLLLTTDKAKQLTDGLKDGALKNANDLKDTALKNVKGWREKLSKVRQDGMEAVAEI